MHEVARRSSPRPPPFERGVRGGICSDFRFRLRLSPIASRLSPGFTLIELVVVIAIIAILATGLLPLAELANQRSKESELHAALRDIRTAIDAYKQATDEGRVERKADETGYPPSLELLAAGVPNAKDPEKHKIYFMRRVPRDPFFVDSEVAAHKTWGLRSYESPPEEPKDGKDVFDVYSLSQKKGLNGVPYNKW
jgi:general secretion pathway protein G